MTDAPASPPTAPTPAQRRRFRHIAASGITFQGGSAAVDSGTIMAALVHQLTGSALAVGAVTAILRFGWLSPQLFVGFLAQRRGSSLRYYGIGGFGRATCMALLAALLFSAGHLPGSLLAAAVLVLWTAYSFVSGIVAVPYNDIVARSVASGRRSRLLALRFFGGGVLALAVAAIADLLVGRLPFPASFAAIVAIAALLMCVSAAVFVSAGEPARAAPAPRATSFRAYLHDGRAVFREDRRFRLFVAAQWCGGAVLVAMPFYVVEAAALGLDYRYVAVLLGAQTAGALASNFLWGWWGDRLGKGSVLRAVAAGRMVPPLVVLALGAFGALPRESLLSVFVVLFFVLGGLANGLTIAVIGYLMEVSPEDRRPAYSGYFNALTAPAFLFPLAGGGLAAALGMTSVFAVSLAAAAGQSVLLLRLRRVAG